MKPARKPKRSVKVPAWAVPRRQNTPQTRTVAMGGAMNCAGILLMASKMEPRSSPWVD